MKFPNYLKNAFVGLGIVSLIFYTCAAADEIASDDNNNNPQKVNTYGKYQISTNGGYVNAGQPRLVVLNTETGVTKSYEWSTNLGWTQSSLGNITFTH